MFKPKENYHEKRKPAILVAKSNSAIFIVSIRIFDASVNLCWFSTYYLSYALAERPFGMSRMPTFGTDEGLSILYLPFVLSTPSSGGKKYLRRAKISI